MAILFAGSEDIDFPDKDINGISTSSSYCRTDFARACINMGGSPNYIKSPILTPFSSAWFSCIISRGSYWGGNDFSVIHFENSSNDHRIGIGSGDAVGKVCIFKYDGTTQTRLAVSSSTPLIQAVELHKIDMQVLNYGTNGTVNVWVDNNFCVSYTGNIASGGTTLDRLHIKTYQITGYASGYFSEIIVADEDTRLMSLKTLVPNAAGDTNEWTGAYTDVDEVVINDSDTVYTDTAEEDVQFNLTDMPAGNFEIKAVIASARIADGLGTLDAQLGIKTNGSVNLGSTITLDSGWQTARQMWTQNPITASPFTVSEINALQAMVRSKSK